MSVTDSLELTSPKITRLLEAISKASELTRSVQSQMAMGEIEKKDRSPVTVGDFGAQAIIGHYFSKYFSEDVLVGEEQADFLRSPEGAPILEKVTDYVKAQIADATGDLVCDWIDQGNGETGQRFWTLDPIDGTKGFLRGEQYAVGLSLVEDGEVKLGMIACPNLSAEGEAAIGSSGSVVVAIKNQGVWISPMGGDFDFKAIKVSENRETESMRLLRSVEAKHTNSSRTQKFMELLSIQAEPIYMDSQAKYVLVALGKGDSFFYLLPPKRPEYRMKIWDVAPGAIVIEEAGGKITDLEGKDLDFTKGLSLADNPGLLITNGFLHQKVLEGIKAISEDK